MATCLRPAYVGAIGSGTTVYLQNESKVVVEPLTNPKVSIIDLAINDPFKCSIVGLSGADYQALVNRVGLLENKPSGSTGGSTVNVTADIFVGAALVCIFVLGWIAGAQR